MNIELSHGDQLYALMLGSAVGDAIGLPREGLTPTRAAKLFPGKLRHAFIGSTGFFSDDTEHMWMTAWACIDAQQHPARFEKSLARRMRWWLLRLPAGVGLATLRSIVKHAFGVRRGVYSAGNGPAMRAPILGVLFRDDPNQLRNFVWASTRLTHMDPRAGLGAMAVAVAAAAASRADFTPEALLKLWMQYIENWDFLPMLQRALDMAGSNAENAAFLREFQLHRGVTGYIYHTVPAAMFCWLKHRHDYRAALEAVMELGGDTDTVGAIAGALTGLTAGVSSIPSEWVGRLKDWPVTPERLRILATALAENTRPNGLQGFRFGTCQFLRNLIFIPIVLAHGFRRLAPPY